MAGLKVEKDWGRMIDMHGVESVKFGHNENIVLLKNGERIRVPAVVRKMAEMHIRNLPAAFVADVLHAA